MSAVELEDFHRFRGIPLLVRGGTIDLAAADSDGRVRWRGHDGTERVVDLQTGEIAEAPSADAPPATLPEGLPSPDGRLLASVSDHDITLTTVGTGDKRVVTSDGTADSPWSAAMFTGDGTRLLAMRSDLADRPTYPLVDWLGLPCTVTDVPHMPEAAPAPPTARLALIDTSSAELTWVEGFGRCDLMPLWASTDGAYVVCMAWDKVNTIGLVRIDAATGAVTELMVDHVVNTVPYLYAGLNAAATRLSGFEGMLWASDRDGHLRLYAVPVDGSGPRPLTPAGVQLSQPTTHILPKTVVTLGDTIVLMAHTHAGRPYDVQACVTNLAGEFRVVRAEEGVHSIAPVAGADAFLDRHSSHTRPPRTDLCRPDGTLVATLEIADVSDAEALGRQVPEEFTVKAADGVTDLHGLLFKPVDFDPSRSYPLVDIVYGGPQQIAQTMTYVSPYASNSPWTDWAGLAAAFTRLGFVGIVLDGRGTPGRGRDFQGAAGLDFPNLTAQDHATAIRTLAAERPWIDASRCGALGHSFGGYHAVRCGLNAPDVYKAVVSAAGAFEPALQDRTFGEGLFGVSYQDDPSVYEDAGCSAHAKELEPELLIIAGTHDTNVHLVHAMRFSEALIQAGKHHDLMILQGKDHALDGIHGEQALDRAARFFCEHLR